jgi:4-hydroxymandelate oxidase
MTMEASSASTGTPPADSFLSLLTVRDYERRAQELVLPAMFGALYGGDGAYQWDAHTNNLAAFRSRQLRPRVLRGAPERNLATTVLGLPIELPVILGPAGHQQRNHIDGELASARAAGAAGTIFCLSTAASYSIEEVAEVATGPLWFQLYTFSDREVSEILIRRATGAGYRALMMTVDNPGVGSRETDSRYVRHNYSLAREHEVVETLEEERVLRNLYGIDRPGLPTQATFTDSFDQTLSWDDLEWARSLTSMPLILKGIQTAEDASIAAELGVDAIYVSNHGGHALKDARGTLDILPEVVEAVKGKLEVYIDGGVQRGSDILKCLALGARAVMIGRAALYGLTVGGEQGVSDVLRILSRELREAMIYCGVRDVREVERALVT